MLYSDCNLRQLLEFALQVPEVGAVNFNILYIILKTIIQNQGLESVKPHFNLDEPVLPSSGKVGQPHFEKTVKQQSPSSTPDDTHTGLKQSYSKLMHGHEAEEHENDETISEANKWNTLRFFKALRAAEEEISDLHIMIGHLVDKISNIERMFYLQESKSASTVADMEGKMQESEICQLERDDVIKNKFEEINNDINVFKNEIKDEMGNQREQLSSAQENAKMCDAMLGVQAMIKDIEFLKTSCDNLAKNNQDTESEIKKLRKLYSLIDLKFEEFQVSGSARYQELMEQIKKIEAFVQAKQPRLAQQTVPNEETASAEKEALSKQTVPNEETASTKKEPLSEQTVPDEETASTEKKALTKQTVPSEETVSTKKEPVSKQATPSEQLIHISQASPAAEVASTELISTTEPSITVEASPTERVTPAEFHEEKIDDSKHDAQQISAMKKLKFQAIARNIALIKDLEKNKMKLRYQKQKEGGNEKVEGSDGSGSFDEASDEEYAKSMSSTEFNQEHEELNILPGSSYEYPKSFLSGNTIISPDLLEEHSRQLKGQVIVYVKKRIGVFSSDLQHMESDVVTVKKKVEYMEKQMREVIDKLAIIDENFIQKADNLIDLKKMVQNHQISIMNIMHQLDRKAEAYTVNLKVSKTELTALEDRVYKLSIRTSSEITGLEDKLEDMFQKFHSELDKKLYFNEFDVRLEPLKNKQERIEKKLKEFLCDTPVVNFDDIRPVEIRRYVLSKDGTKVKQDTSTLMEQGIFREDRHYACRAYTKIKDGRN